MGLGGVGGRVPGVAVRTPQPRAGGRNPVGIRRKPPEYIYIRVHQGTDPNGADLSVASGISGNSQC